MRIQWKPNVIRKQKRICLTRLRWETGKPGDGKGYSNKLSISLCWVPGDIWVGVYIRPKRSLCYERFIYICVIPCLPIRIHKMKAYGGIFP
jgi:hypothetical protein